MASHLSTAERELLEVSVALYGWATHAEALEATTKAVETLIDVRVAAERERIVSGVCPCCNRTFQNLARHIAGQHPDFAEPAGGEH